MNVQLKGVRLVLAPLVDERDDRVFHLLGAVEHAMAKHTFVENPEKQLHLVNPRSMDGGVVEGDPAPEGGSDVSGPGPASRISRRCTVLPILSVNSGITRRSRSPSPGTKGLGCGATSRFDEA